MSGRESRHIVFQKITVFIVFCFLLLQTGVFIKRAVTPLPEAEPVPEEPEVIRDTVYVWRDRAPRNYGAQGRTERKSGNVPSRGQESAEEESIKAEVHSPKAVSDWKWNVVELNSADSAALDDLPGIGGYYAKQILRYRAKLGSFVSAEQLLEIQGIDSARFARLSSRVKVDVSNVKWIDLNTVSEEELAAHPYVGRMAARGIIRLRGSISPNPLTLEDIVANGILLKEAALRLGRYVR